MQQRVLVGVVGQTVERVADAVDRGVHPRRQERAHQQRRVLRIDLAGIGGLVDLLAEAARPQLVALAVRHDPLRDLGDARRALRQQLVARPHGVEDHVAIDQQILPAVVA